jgi:hypothetical protein
MLRLGLANARAPRGAWVVTMRIEPGQGGQPVLSAEGDVTDDEGVNVAHRFLSGSSATCSSLARAIGIWASLVLDAELARALGPSSDPPLEPSRPPLPPPREASVDPLLPNHDVRPPPRVEPHGPEIGIGGFMMAQTVGRTYAGVTPYALIDVGHGVFLRPAVAVGESLPQAGPDAQWLVGRVDACSRLQGLYGQGHGLELTFCGGADAGVTHDNALPGAPMRAYFELGPGVDLQGDIVENVSAVLRGVGGAEIVPQGWSGRFEFAVAWRMP